MLPLESYEILHIFKIRDLFVLRDSRQILKQIKNIAISKILKTLQTISKTSMFIDVYGIKHKLFIRFGNLTTSHPWMS